MRSFRSVPSIITRIDASSHAEPIYSTRKIHTIKYITYNPFRRSILSIGNARRRLI